MKGGTEGLLSVTLWPDEPVGPDELLWDDTKEVAVEEEVEEEEEEEDEDEEEMEEEEGGLDFEGTAWALRNALRPELAGGLETTLLLLLLLLLLL